MKQERNSEEVVARERGAREREGVERDRERERERGKRLKRVDERRKNKGKDRGEHERWQRCGKDLVERWGHIYGK